MPKMGESITEGTIINWLVAEGDTFEEGDILVEVATDKVDNEVPAPASGTLIKTMFQANDVVPVGEVMAILEVSEEKKSNKTAKDFRSSVAKNKAQQKKPKASNSNSNSVSNSSSFSISNPNQFFSPLIISIAKEQHISCLLYTSPSPRD